jgi:hypothetical protein
MAIDLALLTLAEHEIVAEPIRHKP